MKIKKDDTVKLLVGKDLGKSGKVLRVLAKEGKVLVEGLNIFKRHIRRRGRSQGGIIELAKPVDISNVLLVCPNCSKTTRVGYKIENNVKYRICKKCKEVIKGGK